jgi:hypothetical protein
MRFGTIKTDDQLNLFILDTFNRTLSIHWRTHSGSLPHEYAMPLRSLLYIVEATRCTQIRINGFPSQSSCPAANTRHHVVSTTTSLPKLASTPL